MRAALEVLRDKWRLRGKAGDDVAGDDWDHRAKIAANTWHHCADGIDALLASLPTELDQ